LSREENEKDIRRWKRYFPGRVIFHFSISGIEKWNRTFPGISLFHIQISFYSLGQYFSAGVGKQKCSPGTNTVFYTSKNPKIAYFCLLKTAAKFS
jgi:hypothetical protein